MIDMNAQVTPNFTMKEAFDWIKLFNQDKNFIAQYYNWCGEDWTLEKQRRLLREFKRLQAYRDAVNRKFPEFGGRIGVRITSGVRPRSYEVAKGRGPIDSRHRYWDALDFDIVLNGEAFPEPKRSGILRWLWTDIDANHSGGAAISYRQDGTVAFIHTDGRGERKRWRY